MKKVKFNLIQQNIYVRENAEQVVEDKQDYAVDSYESLDEVVTEKGVELVRSTQEYPITPESVNSFIEASNYKNNLEQALQSSPRGQNIGDVAELQDILSRNPQAIADFFKQAVEKVNASKAEAAADNKEVANNG